jgi:AraC-like DNA-binding protein
VLSTSANHLGHVRLLNDAWLGKPSTAIDDGALEILRNALAATQSARPTKHEHRYTVQAVKELVNRSLSKPPTLAEVAQQFYLSPFTVSHMFRKETGISLRRYTNRLRLRKALYMMLCGSLALTDIAVELGFYDEPHFSKAFNAEFGIAPAFALGPLCSRSKQRGATASSNTAPDPLSAGRSGQE